MDEHKDFKPQAAATEPDFEGIVRRESEEALRRFRSGDFSARVKSRLEAPLPRPAFFLFRRSVFAPVLGLVLLAAGAAAIFYFVDRGNERIRIEAGFRQITESLSHYGLFRAGAKPEATKAGQDATSTGGDAQPFIEALFRAAAGQETKTGRTPSGSVEGGAPLRPLFSPKERFKILYEDQVILRVLTSITNQKEV